jgi:co-chaperonin GroES (HSP10)
MSTARKYEHTEEELIRTQKQIEKELGFEPIETLGYHIAVWLHEPNKGSEIDKKLSYKDPVTGEVKKSLLEAPDDLAKNIADEDKWTECVGLVIYLGDEAYKTGKFADGKSKPWCKLGDWVVFPRHEGTLISYRDKPVMLIPDDRVIARIPDPSYVSRFK